MNRILARTLSVAALGVGLTLSPLATPSHAQDPTGTSSGTTGVNGGSTTGTSTGIGDTGRSSTTTGNGAGRGGARTDRDADDGFNWGWLGLIGLAGLMGLMPRRDHHTTTTHRVGDNR
ncbi:MAG: WGxxGxxG family protein [Isosphaeraceae bacterium]